MADPSPDPARGRYFLMTFARLGTVFLCLAGLVVIGRSVSTGGRILGVAIVLAGLVLMATVPRELARKWRSPRS